jgi:hypothetical protein
LRFDQHRLGIHDRRRAIVPDLHLSVHARRHLPRQHDAEVQVARLSAADAGIHDCNEGDYTHEKNPLRKIGKSGRTLNSSLVTVLGVIVGLRESLHH